MPKRDGCLRFALAMGIASASVFAGAGDAARADAPVPLFEPSVWYPTGDAIGSVAIGDVDGDGRNDLVAVGATAGSLSVWIQRTDGTLAARRRYQLSADSRSVAVADVDGDGLADVIVGMETRVAVLRQDGLGGLAAAQEYAVGGQYIRVADVTSDGRTDVVAWKCGSNTLAVLRGGPGPALLDPVVYAVPSAHDCDLAVGDVNGDSRNDVVLALDNGSSQLDPHIDTLGVLEQQADGTLRNGTQIAVPSNLADYRGLAIGDVTGDRRDDLVAAAHGSFPTMNRIAIYAAREDGTLPLKPARALQTVGYVSCVIVTDVTGDGRGDLVFQDAGSVAVVPQLPGGVLGPEEVQPGPYSGSISSAAHHTMAVGDVDGDGRSDIAVASGVHVALYRRAAATDRVTVTSPAHLAVKGFSTAVEWTASGDIAAFDVSYSLDDGETFTPIPGCTDLPAGTTSCLWLTPDAEVSLARLRVAGRRAAAGPSIVGTSALKLVKPSLLVDVQSFHNSPGNFVEAGVERRVLIIGELGPRASVVIELSRDGGASWEHLGTHAAPESGGSYFPWMVTNPTTGDAVIRASWAGPSLLTDTTLHFAINHWPVADSGPDQSAFEGEPVVLDGSRSQDGDRDPLSYEWYLEWSGPLPETAVRKEPIATGSVITVSPPVGRHEFLLLVRDSIGALGADYVQVTVRPTPTILVSAPGPGQVQAVGTPQTVRWRTSASVEATLSIALSRDGGVTWEALADGVPNTGMWTGNVAGPATRRARVRVSWPQHPLVTGVSEEFALDHAPVASAGADQTVNVGTSAILDGRASVDADADPITWQWEANGVVVGREATLLVIPWSRGTTTYTLTVEDDLGLHSSDTVDVEARPARAAR